jgi:hypothetical protein
MCHPYYASNSALVWPKCAIKQHPATLKVAKGSASREGAELPVVSKQEHTQGTPAHILKRLAGTTLSQI